MLERGHDCGVELVRVGRQAHVGHPAKAVDRVAHVLVVRVDKVPPLGAVDHVEHVVVASIVEGAPGALYDNNKNILCSVTCGGN